MLYHANLNIIYCDLLNIYPLFHHDNKNFYFVYFQSDLYSSYLCIKANNFPFIYHKKLLSF